MDKDGMVYLRGRVDDMIVSGGENVYPQVVEQVLAQHADIADVAVTGTADADYGQRLHAFVTTRQPVCPDALLLWLKDKVARYEMPASITILDELPVTPLGKPDKRALLEMYFANEMVS
jgi:acyl-CoA synthetase (AMP-forming)/AMP-acid ligase II